MLVASALDGGAEGILEQLGDDVLEVHGHEGEGGVRLAVNDAPGSYAILVLANIGHESGARVHNGGGGESGIDDAYVAWAFRTWRRRGGRIEVRHATIVEGDVLLSDQAGSYACAKVGVEETGDLCRGNVPTALEEALGQDGDGILMGGHELGKHRGEANLVVYVGYGAMLPRKQGRE